MQPAITIALADDYEPLRREFARLLTTLGFNVVIQAIHGQDLLARLQAAPELPALCLLDINMPVMDGYATARHMRQLYPGIRILAISFAKEPGEINEILQAGAHAFLFKDTTPEALMEALLRLCET